jgi:hypothetical protein
MRRLLTGAAVVAKPIDVAGWMGNVIATRPPMKYASPSVPSRNTRTPISAAQAVHHGVVFQSGVSLSGGVSQPCSALRHPEGSECGRAHVVPLPLLR